MRTWVGLLSGWSLIRSTRPTLHAPCHLTPPVAGCWASLRSEHGGRFPIWSTFALFALSSSISVWLPAPYPTLHALSLRWWQVAADFFAQGVEFGFEFIVRCVAQLDLLCQALDGGEGDAVEVGGVDLFVVFSDQESGGQSCAIGPMFRWR